MFTQPFLTIDLREKILLQLNGVLPERSSVFGLKLETSIFRLRKIERNSSYGCAEKFMLSTFIFDQFYSFELALYLI